MAVTLPKPSITDIVDDKGSVTESVDAGSRTDDTVLVLKGKARAGTTVEVFDGDTSLGSASADQSGNWTFTTAELDQGGHAFKVIASNAKGDTSPASTVYRITVDTDAPAAPVFTVRDDAGRLVGDITVGTRTDDASPILQGKTEARATVEVFDGRKSLGTVTANSKGVWSYVAEDLKDGLHTLRAIATDTAGNSGDAHTFRLTVDTKPPKAPTLASVTDNTGTVKGSVPDNGSTNDKTPTLAGDAPAGAMVELFDADRSLGTTTAGKNGVWKFTSPELADGSHILTAATVDTLGTYSVASNAITINLDTLPPEPPAIASVNDNVGKVKGNVADGKKTDDTTLVLKGVVDAGSEVTLYDYDTRIGVVSADRKGRWNFTTDELDNGSVHVFTARVRDAVGNLSDASASRTVTIATGAADTVAPFAPSVDTVTDDAGEVTGPVRNKGQSDDTTLTLSGTAEAGSTVKVFDGKSSLGTVKAGKSGDWTFTTPTLTDGPHGFTVTATDAAKNVSDISSTFTVNVDAAAPAAPVIGSASDDAGRIKGDLASGQVTDDALPVLKGTAEAGSRVELFDAGVSLGTVKAGKAGGWVFTPAELKDGSHNFTATASDSAGNTSPASAAFTLTVNTRQPKTPDITRVGDNVGRVKGAVDSGSSTDDTTLSLTGKAAGNSTVEIFDGSLSLGSVTAKANGAWSFETPVLAEGNHILTAVASNAVGSLSPASDTFDLTINTQPPLAPVISTVQDDVGKTRGPVANNGKTDDTTPTLSGTATAGVTVEVLDYATRLASVIADQDGQWTYTTETLENGSVHVFSARAVDGNGLVSASGNDYTLTINTGKKDVVPPFIPTISVITDNREPNTGSVNNKGKSNDATLTLSGTAEANSTVQVFDGKSSLGTVKADKGGDWTFTTPALKDGSHGFTARATDAAKNASGISKSYTITTDATAPTLDLGSDKASLKAGETAAVTFKFSEAPTGFGASDVTVTGGSLSGLKVGTDAKVYTGVFTPTTNTNSLTASVSVAAGSYTDAFGNVGTGSTASLKTDTLAPTLSLSSDKTSLKVGETATLTFKFSEAPTGFETSDVTVTGGTLGSLKVGAGGTVYTALYTPTAGSGSVVVPAARYTDAAGNTGTASNTLAFSANLQPPVIPTLILGSDKTSLKAGETARLTFTFNQIPTGFETTDITASGGTLSGLKVDAANSKVYTALFTPTPNSNNLSATLKVAAGTYSGTGGTTGTASNTLILTGDTLAPTLSISSDKTNLKAGETATLTFKFSETPTGFETSDVTVTGGTLSGLKAGTDAKVYTGLFTPTANTNSLTASVSVAAGSYTDAAGNAGGAGSAGSLKGDTLVPNLTISSDKTSLKAGETATLTFKFSETPTGFETSDVTVTGGTLSGLKAGTDAKVYTGLFTPTANTNSLTASVSVAAGSYTDAAGNAGGAGSAVSLKGDTLAPTLSLSSDKANLKAGETAAVTFSFSEAPTGFETSDVTVTGGTLSGLKAGTDAKVYTGLFTPTANTNSLTASVSVAAGSYTDAAGNAGGAGSAVSLKGDTLAPTLSLSSDKANLKAGETAAVTFSFSEAPTGFETSDVTVTGGTLSGLKAGTDAKVYTGLFTPTANTNSLTGSVSVAAGSYSDAAGNAGGAGSAVSLKGDTLAPTLSLSSDKASLKAGETATLTFKFSEVPTGFIVDDLTITGGAVTNLKASVADAGVYTAQFTPTANTNNLTATISVPVGSYADPIGNRGAASSSLTLTADTQAPGVNNITASASSLTAGQTATLTFNFSEEPTGFDLADISVSAGSVASLSGGGLSRSVIYTPPANASGSLNVSVAASSYTDAVGNPGTTGGSNAIISYNTVQSSSGGSSGGGSSGSGSSGSGSNTNTPTSLTGKVIDGYIKEAGIFRDADSDGVFDGGEVFATTDSLGGYTLPGGSGPLVASGGTDISTNLPFIGVLKAPAGSTVVTPLTTLVAAIQALTPSLTLTQAQSRVATALGLGSTGVDFTSFDPIANSTGANSAVALQVQKAAIQVSNIIVQATKAVQGADTNITSATAIANVASHAVTTLANLMTGSTVDLTNTTTLSNVLTSTGSSAGLTGANLTNLTNTASAVASVMAATNTAAQSATTLTNLVQTQVVAQGSGLTTALRDAVNNQSAGDLTSNYTGTALTTAISTAQVGIINTTNVGLNETISAAGSKTATSQNDIFTLRSGEYAYSISGFGNGDKLIFFNGAILNVIPDTNDADGSQSLTATDPLSGATTTLNLIGLTPAQDAGIFNIPSLEAMFTGDTVTIGSTTTAVSANGSISATPAADVFTIAAGNYTYTIDGFTSGDQLSFFPGAILNVVPDSNQTDGSQQLTATNPMSGATTTIVLTGLSSSQDGDLFNVSSFYSVFGNGAIA